MYLCIWYLWFYIHIFQEIRRLQNEMDKARIKYEAARNITKRYQEIMRYMEEVYMANSL